MRLSSTKGQCDTTAPHYLQDTEVLTKNILWWIYRQNRAEFKTEQSEALWRLTVGLKTAREVREEELMGYLVSFKKQSQFSMEIDWPQGNLINFFTIIEFFHIRKAGSSQQVSRYITAGVTPWISGYKMRTLTVCFRNVWCQVDDVWTSKRLKTKKQIVKIE